LPHAVPAFAWRLVLKLGHDGSGGCAKRRHAHCLATLAASGLLMALPSLVMLGRETLLRHLDSYQGRGSFKPGFYPMEWGGAGR
jgi:hypothetical protein